MKVKLAGLGLFLAKLTQRLNRPLRVFLLLGCSNINKLNYDICLFSRSALCALDLSGVQIVLLLEGPNRPNRALEVGCRFD